MKIEAVLNAVGGERAIRCMDVACKRASPVSGHLWGSP